MRTAVGKEKGTRVAMRRIPNLKIRLQRWRTQVGSLFRVRRPAECHLCAQRSRQTIPYHHQGVCTQPRDRFSCDISDKNVGKTKIGRWEAT